MRQPCQPHRHIVGLAVLLLASPFSAVPAVSWSLDVHETVLSNGLRVLVVERRHVPLVECQVWVGVGSAYETLGRTGLAHLHEHLLFKGTRRLGTTDYEAEAALMERQDEVASRIQAEQQQRGGGDASLIAALSAELQALEEQQRQYAIPSHVDQIYRGAGATGLNAGTWFDYTFYTVTVPSNKLELAMWVDSDRFLEPVFREFYSEREVVKEERKQALEDRPSGPYQELMNAVTLPESSYSWEIIGRMSDLDQLTRAEAYEFLRTYYVPCNMCLILVGDVQADEAFGMAERYFGRLPAAQQPPRIRSRQRLDIGERRIRVEAQAMPMVRIQFPTTVFGTPEDAALEVVQGVLTGESGRLHKDLVLGRRIAVRCSAWNGTMRDSGRFVVLAAVASTSSHQEVEDALWRQVEVLQTEPVSESELGKVKKQVRAGMIRSMRDNSGLARMLGTFWAETGDWRNLLTAPDLVDAVSSEDVMAVAARYFGRRNSTVGWLVPRQELSNP